jgi:adenine-specific DNA-methyltransferase
VLCLIDRDRPEQELRKRYTLFWKYVETGKERAIDAGYLASRRTPWYAQEKRNPAPFLCTYMGRTGNGRKPFRFLWNHSAALASNLYSLLFPKGPLQAALRADAQLSTRSSRRRLCVKVACTAAGSTRWSRSNWDD